MNKDQFALLQARAKIVALQTLLDWTADLLRVMFLVGPASDRPATYAAFRAKLAATREEYSTIGFPELAPEMSDMQAAEFQEVFEELSKDLERKVCGNGT